MTSKRKPAKRIGRKSKPPVPPSKAAPDPDLLLESPLAAESVADSLGIVREADEKFLELWGYKNRDDVVGRPVLHFMKDQERASHIFAWLERMGTWRGCFEALTKGRRPLKVRALMRVLRDESGHRTGFLARFVKDEKCDEADPNSRP